MGTEKEERHAHDHDHHHRREEPASTDMADIIKAENAAKAASERQRRHLKGAEKEYGKGAKSDINSRMILVNVADGQTQITIAAGEEQGVRTGMGGYIKVGDGMLAEFHIHSVEAVTSRAYVDLDTHAAAEVTDVVINPTSKPAPCEDRDARLLGVSIVGDYVKILIGAGAGQGVRKGMKGFLHAPDSDRAAMDFTINEVHARTSYAFVKSPNLDEVQRHPMAKLNPTSGGAKHEKPHADKAHH